MVICDHTASSPPKPVLVEQNITIALSPLSFSVPQIIISAPHVTRSISIHPIKLFLHLIFHMSMHISHINGSDTIRVLPDGCICCYKIPKCRPAFFFATIFFYPFVSLLVSYHILMFCCTAAPHSPMTVLLWLCLCYNNYHMKKREKSNAPTCI